MSFTKVLCSTCNGGMLDWDGQLPPTCGICKSKKPIMLIPLGKVIPSDNPKTALVPTRMKNGEIRKLPASNSPMWTEQWAVQGTAVKPYIVSRKALHAKSSLEWGCSCPDWTKHSPRTNCKHILNVIVKEKLAMPAAQGMDEQTAKEFAAFQKAKAKKQLGIKDDWGISTGRKFR